MATLEDLGNGVHCWLSRPARRGHSNCGVVVDDDGLSVIDSRTTPTQSAALLVALEPLGLSVKRVVLTTSHIEFVGGSSTFGMAGIYGTAQTSAHLDQPVNIEMYQRMFPELSADFAELATKVVSHVVTENAYISARAIAIPVSGELGENLVVQVPDANVVFAGAMACFGITPNAFDGDPEAWAQSLDQLVEWGQIIVPGHGRVGDRDDVVALQAYLWACVEAEGDPTMIPAGPWDQWPGREFDVVNVQRAHMLASGDSTIPPAMLTILGIES